MVFVLSRHIQDEETIVWESSRKLNWTDFKGVPENTRAAAITASGLTYEFSTIKKNGAVVVIDYKVSSCFYPHKSWYRPEVCDTIILNHEQLHFDITEVYARELRKRLKEKKFTSNVKNEVKTIYRQITIELNKYQEQYDTATNFSRNREQQLSWNKTIAETLAN